MLRAWMRPRSASATFTTEKHTSHTRSSAHTSAIAIVQDEDTAEFRLGSDPASHIVLQVPATATEPPWINLCHATIYPDPDTDAIHLYNTSATVFSIRKISKAEAKDVAQVPRSLKPKHNTALARGSWHVRLAPELEFEIEVIPATSDSLGGLESYTALLPSPSHSPVPRRSRPSLPNKSLPSLPKTPGEALSKVSQSLLPDQSLPNESPLQFPPTAQSPPTDKQPDSQRNRDKNYPATPTPEPDVPKHEVPTVELPSACREGQPESQMPKSFVQGELIQTTGLSTVTKVTRGGNVVAIKKPRKGNAWDNALVWQGERQTLMALRHPNITQLVESNAQDLSLTMAYGGLNLCQFCNDCPSAFTVEVRERVFIDIGEALAYTHAKGFLHNDIKEQNILVEPDGSKAILCDFGIATMAGERASLGGTPQYLPPEFIKDSARQMPGDVWAFGVVMLWMLDLLPEDKSPGYFVIARLNDPKVRKKAEAWCDRILKLKEKTTETWILIREMLCKDPGTRITAAELIAQLRLRGQKSQAAPTQALLTA